MRGRAPCGSPAPAGAARGKARLSGAEKRASVSGASGSAAAAVVAAAIIAAAAAVAEHGEQKNQNDDPPEAVAIVTAHSQHSFS